MYQHHLDSILASIRLASKDLAVDAAGRPNVSYLEARQQQVVGMIELAALLGLPPGFVEVLEAHAEEIGAAASEARRLH